MDVAILRNLSGEIFLAEMSGENLKRIEIDATLVCISICVSICVHACARAVHFKDVPRFSSDLYICLHRDTTVKYTETVVEARSCRQDTQIVALRNLH